MTAWEDRAIDAALQELHGSRPPDLSARVVLALREPAAGPLPRLAPSAPPDRRGRWPWVAALLASLALGCGLALACWLALPTAAARPLRATLDVSVLDGDVTCRGIGHDVPPRRVGSGRTLAFVASSGSRLHCERASTFRLCTFGTLTAIRDTELEIREMTFTKVHGVTAAASLTLAVVAGVVTWHTLTRSESAAAGELVRLEAGGGLPPAAAVTAENEQLRQRIEALERQNRDLLAQASRRDTAPPVPTPAPAAATAAPDAPAPPATSSMAFADDRFAALAKIDWTVVGSVVHEMGPLLAKLAAAMKDEDAELPMDLALKVQQLNSKLVEMVPTMLDAGLPGFGPNGVYTHPVVVANSLASTLSASGQPLTDVQQKAIDGLMRSFSVEAQTIADAQREFPLEQLQAELDMKDRMYRELGNQLTPQQLAAMHPEGGGQYDGTGLFSTGLLTQVHAAPVRAANADEFARNASSKLAEQLGLDDASTAQVRALIARVTSAPELWQTRAEGMELSQMRMMRAGRTQAALRYQLEWMRQLQQEVPLTSAQRERLAKMRSVMVPLPR
jgi:cell division protein FtsB